MAIPAAARLKQIGMEFIGKQRFQTGLELSDGDLAVPIRVEDRILPGDDLGGQFPGPQKNPS